MKIEEEIKEEQANIYNKDYRAVMEEDDELSAEEAGFMDGYDNAFQEEE